MLRGLEPRLGGDLFQREIRSGDQPPGPLQLYVADGRMKRAAQRGLEVGFESGARAFYETEALRGGWSVRQLDRQIATLVFERTARSRWALSGDGRALQQTSGHAVPPEEEIKPIRLSA